MTDSVRPVFDQPLARGERPPYDLHELRKTVIGIVRFSVLSNLRNHFLKAKEVSLEEYAGMVLSQDRLEKRFGLFESVTLPSLEAQEYQNFLIYVVAPERLGDRYRARLAGLSGKYPFLRVIYAKEEGFQMKQVSEKVLSEINTDDGFATFRLDDDDALRYDFTKRLSRFVKSRYQKLSVSLCKGYFVDISDPSDVRVEEGMSRNCAAGLAVIGGSRYRKTIFDISEKHKNMHIRLPVITDGKNPAFAMTTHGDNDTGKERSVESASIDLSECESVMRQAGFFTHLSDLQSS